jgi:hypothetical protein
VIVRTARMEIAAARRSTDWRGTMYAMALMVKQ